MNTCLIISFSLNNYLYFSDNIQTIARATGTELFTGENAVASGFGRTSDAASKLFSFNVYIISLKNYLLFYIIIICNVTVELNKYLKVVILL